MRIGHSHPIDVGTRFFLAPINTGFGRDGQPDQRLIEFHRQRSGKGIGISLVGNVSIDRVFRSNATTLYFGQSVGPWSDLSEAITRGGSLPGVQLACKLPSSLASRKWRNRSPGVYIADTSKQIGELRRSEINSICERFVEAADFARRAGFKVIQVHAAHGYFLSQLLTPALNLRTDEFSPDGIVALQAIIHGIRATAPEVIVDVRLSVLDGINSREEEWQWRSRQIDALVHAKPGMISLSAGNYEIDRFMIYPKKSSGYGIYLPYGIRLAKANPRVIWNVAGNFWALPSSELDLPSNLSLSFGRSLIADPSFIEKQLEGRASEVVACVRSGHCHYFTRGQSHIECKVNRDI